MPLIPLRPLLEVTVKYGFDQDTFNVSAVAQAKAAIEVHKMFRSAAILRGANLTDDSMGGRTDFTNATLAGKKIDAKSIVDTVKKHGADFEIPIILHLGHRRDHDSCVAVIEGGYTSAMIDGSSLPFKGNIGLMREVVRYVRVRSVSVEGELGALADVEDHVSSTSPIYTGPLDVVEFFEQTSVGTLAISYGTMHGASKGKGAKLRRKITIVIRKYMNHAGVFGALVPHGSPTTLKYIVGEINTMGDELTNTYSISIEGLKAAILAGISKINVGTDIRLAVIRNMKELFAKYPKKRTSTFIDPIYELLETKKNQFDPRVFLPPTMGTVMYGNVSDEDVAAVVSCVERGVKEVVGTSIAEFGFSSKAPLVEQVSLDEMTGRYKEMKK